MQKKGLLALSGLGPKRLAILEKSGIASPWQLARHLPRAWLDRSKATPIAQCAEDTEVVVVGVLQRCGVVPGRKMRFQALLRDEEGTQLTMVFFQGVRWWAQRLQNGMRLAVMGKIQRYRGAQMVHPEIQGMEQENDWKGGLVPVYPLTEEMRTAGLEQRFFRKLIPQLFHGEAPPPENSLSLPSFWADKWGFLPEWENLRRLHLPANWNEIFAGKRQLKMQELLPPCLRMSERRIQRMQQGRAQSLDWSRWLETEKQLPFSLTVAQKSAIEQILAGLQQSNQYHALLQGDVGSGKTVVALAVLVAVCREQIQGALMAPTDILARQHFSWLFPLLEKAGLRSALLVGATNAQERSQILADLAMGKIQVLIGTHAIYSAAVKFHNLALVVIDEQHRFGVHQRELLLQKGHFPDMLVMSATPIPRSLAMTIYGDLETVILGQKPAGRLLVRTRLVEPERRLEMLNYILGECRTGNRCYWIAPRVAEEEGVQSVETLREELCAFSKEWKVAVVHGRLDARVRDQNLEKFAGGEVQVLIATTVVEVGVNVPQANLMVIESPDRFGLAQLHQLRGRVGRGSIQAWCFLCLEQEHPARNRLEEFAATSDGFAIAEMDLRTRGVGDLEGEEQSGSWIFRYFDWWEDRSLIAEVLDICKKLLQGKHQLSREDLEALQLWYQKENE